MKLRKLLVAASAFLVLCPLAATAHDEEEGKGKLGKVAFANSCDPKVQPLLQRGVAMLHSFWYSAGGEGLPRRAREGPDVRDRDLGYRVAS